MKRISILLAFLINAVTSSALYVEYGNNVVISKPVYEDVYILGGSVTINAPVFGDLVIAGGTIIINDSVTNDILLAGGTAIFNGVVGDDIRCIGGNMHIARNVEGDVIIGGGTVTFDKEVTIGALLIGGGSVTVDGNIKDGIHGRFGELIINGNVFGNVDCRGGSITINGHLNGKAVLAAGNIQIGDNAVFNNDVYYWNKKGSLDFKQTQKFGKAVYDPSLKINNAQWYYLGATTFIGLLLYLGMALVMILLIQYLFSASMKKAADSIFYHSIKSLGWGAVFIIAVPVAMFLCFITVVGLPVGMILLVCFIILLLLATTITSIITANWFNNQYGSKWGYWKISLTAFWIFILLKLLFLIPFVGWLVTCFTTCMAFGGILSVILKKRKKVIAVVNDMDD